MIPALLSTLLILSSGDARLVGDAHTTPKSPTKNNGRGTTLSLAGAGSRVFLQFDLSDLPPGTTGSQIEAARVRLFVNKVSTAGALDAQPASGAWEELTLTHNTEPALGAPAVVNVAIGTADALDFISIDITTLVRDWVDAPQTNFGLVLTPSPGSGLSVSFDSKENTKTGHEPVLRMSVKPVVTAGAKGDKGDKGDTGEQGLQGLQGAQGVKGDKGDKGDTGEQGLQGLQGAQGVKGDKGDPGIQGIQGVQGAPGPQGATGPQGETGPQGATGSQGETGPQGAIGPVGSTGPQGAPGPQGATGAQGLKGDTGAAGAQGATGPQGAPGPQGVKGDTGAQGAPGVSPFSLNGTSAVYTQGNVGIGTTTPLSKLEVAGTVKFTDTLTVNAPTDQALDLGSGNVYKQGIVFLHSKGSGANTGVGREALPAVTTGSGNTATGSSALFSNSTGGNNVANGAYALSSNTSGGFNTAVGSYAGQFNSTGDENTSVGYAALYSTSLGNYNTGVGSGVLYSNTTANDNTAIGYGALYNNTTGSKNIGIGYQGGAALTTGDNNIMIGNIGAPAESKTIRIGKSGNNTRAFIAGIHGVTTGIANGIPVLIDSNGQLGTVSSSHRFKEDIRDMGSATDRLLDLRPVLFKYKQEQTLPDGSPVPPEYGLIAEEVARIFPDLVVYDGEGAPFTVKYHILSSMLLNEVKKMKAQHEQELQQQREQARRLESVEAELSKLKGAIRALEAGTIPHSPVAGENLPAPSGKF